MAQATTREHQLAVLDGLSAELHEQHPGNAARLEQLDSHLATVRMVVGHLHDEAETG